MLLMYVIHIKLIMYEYSYIIKVFTILALLQLTLEVRSFKVPPNFLGA